MSDKDFLKLWGKADKDKAGNMIWHPLAYHMLDVAAVAEVWLSEDKELQNHFLNKSGFSQKSIVGISTLATALHDVGKATVFFQNKIPEIAKDSNLFYEIAANTRGFDHGLFGYLWLKEWRESETKFQEWAKHYPFMQTEPFLQFWTSACWHHGKVYSNSDLVDLESRENEIKSEGKGTVFDRIVSFRNQTLSFVIQSILENEKWELENIPTELSPSFIRFFAGFVSVCDWIGSNTDYFPYPVSVSPENYWEYSKKQAKAALQEIKIYGNKIEPITSFVKILDSGKSPRTIQNVLENTNITGSSLVIVEAPTGEGKTESALFQFVRNPGRGFYFALPTQASANQISNRIEKFLKDKLQTNEKAILAHGNAWLVREIQKSKKYNSSDLEDKNELDTTAESELCNWFSSKKRTLLTRFGIGTVDQAMLAALNVKHGFVKLFGLTGKTLIIDEVHAYDSFMLPIIEHLLRWCGYLDVSVVLLSATLPSFMKKRLVAAYMDKGEKEIELKKEHYPLLSIASIDNKEFIEIDSFQNEKIGTRKSEIITFSFHSHEKNSIEPIVDELEKRFKDGGNILWICNTVKKAQFVYHSLKNLSMKDTELRLFHSRFTKADRLQKEEEIEILYGDESKSPNRPKKSILVATQVAEQSLDIDFDLLISDIAPIDLILQRAGRIFRHERSNRNTNFCNPEILLLVPNDIGKLKDFAGVYDKFTVCKTILELSKIDGHYLRLPTMYRNLVENVYNDNIPKENTIQFRNITLEISNKQWEDFQKKKQDKSELKDTEARRGLIPSPTNEDPTESALLNEKENSAWFAKTRDGEEKIGLILVHKKNEKFYVGDSLLPEMIPEKISFELANNLSLQTVEVTSKDFVLKARKEESLVSEPIILKKWQEFLDKISQFKGSKLFLFEESVIQKLTLSGKDFQLCYSKELGLQIESQK
jgi:CRISPR-associated endonuclease/helicase Cas3